MKKTYEAPLTVEVKVDLQTQFMAGSPLGRNEEEASVEGGQYTNDLSRTSRSLWDDEDDDL